MKIKIALIGLLFANSIIHPTYADQNEFLLETDAVDGAPMVEGDVALVEGDVESEKAKAEDLIKLGTSITMGPTITRKNGKWSTKNSFGVNLTYKADVPKAWCSKDVTLDLVANWNEEKFTIKKAAVTIAKMVTIGSTDSIFGYEKADADLLISPSATVLQIKSSYAFDWFRVGCAIEKPIVLKVGKFDKNQPVRMPTKENRTNKLDTLTNEKRPFKMENRFPAFGINLGVVTDDLNIGLSGLGSFPDYTHSTNPNAQNLKNKQIVPPTYGGHLGIQYQLMPKKFTATVQGAGVHGLGDYLSGLAAIQAEPREEMCGAYYVDQGKDDLFVIDAWGAGLALAYCATPKWTISIRGSYLGTLEDPQKPEKPGIAFRSKWNVIPKVAYEMNKYCTVSGKYTIAKTYAIKDKYDEPIANELSGSLKFSL